MPDHRADDSDGNVTSWRLEQLEDHFDKLVQAVQSSTTTLGAQITALSNQLGNGLAALPEHYAPRREAEERHSAINAKFLAIEQRQADRENEIEQRFRDLDKRLEERKQNLENRINAEARRTERLERAAWAIAIGILSALAGALFAVFKVTAGGP